MSSGTATEIVRTLSSVRLAMPVSTPPGPSSAIVGDAGVAERLQHLLPAHRAGQLRRQQRGPLACRWSWGLASTLETTGTSESRGAASAIAWRSRSRAGTMNGVWKAPDTGSGITFLAPRSLAAVDGRGDPFGRSGDHDLAGGVEVGDPDVAVGDGGRRPRPGRRRGRAPRPSCRGCSCAGLVHRGGPLDDEAHAVVEAERAAWR